MSLTRRLFIAAPLMAPAAQTTAPPAATPSAPTPATPTPAPSTAAPVAPKPATPAPTTTAPGSTTPGTTAPGTTSPGTTSPGTPSSAPPKPNAPATKPAHQAAHAPALKLRPGGPAVTYRLLAHPVASRLTFAGIREAVVLPGAASVLAAYPIAGRELLAIGFDASALAGVTQKLAALVGWDGRTIRILDVETLHFSSGDAGSPSTLVARITAGPGPQHLRVIASATRSERGTPAHRESWVDVLAWREGAPLTTAPSPIGPAHGTWQTRMEATRARVAALLNPPRTTLTLDMLDPTGLLDPLGGAPQ